MRSARYAGPEGIAAHNIAKLLAILEGCDDRRARFRTVALAAMLDGAELVATGELRGTIATAPRGAGGFGYDAVFLPDGGDGRTLAEMGADEKHGISHRGRALRELAGLLSVYLSGNSDRDGVPVPVHATGRASFATCPCAIAVPPVETAPASTSCRRAGPRLLALHVGRRARG